MPGDENTCELTILSKNIVNFIKKASLKAQLFFSHNPKFKRKYMTTHLKQRIYDDVFHFFWDLKYGMRIITYIYE